MKTILSLFLIQLIVVFIVDISGAVDSLKTALKWILTKGAMSNSNYILKPFDCSLCMTFWCTLIYLLCTTQFTLPFIAVACMLAAFTGLTKSLIILVEDLVVKLTQVIYKYIIDNEDNDIQ